MRTPVIVVGLVMAMAAPRVADACSTTGPYLAMGPTLPLGCPFVVFVQDFGVEFSPQVTALRGTQLVDVTRDFTTFEHEIELVQQAIDCEGRLINSSSFLGVFMRYEIALENLAVGDRVGLGTGWFSGIEIVEAGPGACPAPVVPELVCQSQIGGCGGQVFPDDNIGSGCAAGGVPGIGVALGALLLRRRRR